MNLDKHSIFLCINFTFTALKVEYNEIMLIILKPLHMKDHILFHLYSESVITFYTFQLEPGIAFYLKYSLNAGEFSI